MYIAPRLCTLVPSLTLDVHVQEGYGTCLCVCVSVSLSVSALSSTSLVSTLKISTFT